MKKLPLALSFFLTAFPWLASQDRGPVDLILLLDTSTGMSGSFHELRDYVSGPFLREFLRLGDTFHLISVAAAPRRELSRRVEGVGDVETIIGRLFLMYPVEPSANIAAALDYTGRYITTLPETRRKIVVLITGREQNIPSDAAARTGPDFYAVKFPFAGNAPVSGRPPLRRAGQPRPRTEAAQTEQPVTPPAPQPSPPPVQPEKPAPQRPATQPPPAIQQEKRAPVQSPATQPPAVQPEKPPPRRPAAKPIPLPPQRQTRQPAPVQRPMKPSTPPLPAPQPPPPPVQRPAASPPLSLLPAPQPLPDAENRAFLLFMLTGALGLAASLGITLTRICVRFRRLPNKTLARAAAGGHAAGSTLMLSLFVEDQNTATGRRNIHVIKPGYRYTLGGGKSSYLIFLAPLPPCIAEIHYDGITCLFIPKKPRFFPDLGANPLADCIGKTIRIISDKKYELFIRLEQYEDPLKTLNTLLQSIKKPDRAFKIY